MESFSTNPISYAERARSKYKARQQAANEPKRSFLQNLRERFARKDSDANNATFDLKGRFSNLPQNWWMWLIGMAVVGIAVWQGVSGNISLPSLGNTELKIHSAPQFEVGITFAALAILIIAVWGFAEAYTRRERLLLDWWISPATVAIMVTREYLSHDSWLILITASVIGLGVASFLNESEEQSGWWNIVDLTSVMNVAGFLLILRYANFEAVPYPNWFPIWIVWIVFVGSIIKEVVRSSLGLGLFALVTGVAAAFTLNPWVITTSLVSSIVGVHLAARRGWVNTTKHRRDVQILAGTGRELSLIVPWDVVLAQTYVFAIISFQLYGNFIITSVTGGK